MRSRAYLRVRVWNRFGDDLDPLAFTNVPDDELYHTLRYIAARYFADHFHEGASPEWAGEVLASPPSVIPEITPKAAMLLSIKYGVLPSEPETPKWTVILACDSLTQAESVAEGIPAVMAGDCKIHWDVLEQAKMEQVRWLKIEANLERFDITARPLDSLLKGKFDWSRHPLKRLHEAAKKVQRLLREDEARRKPKIEVPLDASTSDTPSEGSPLDITLSALPETAVTAWKQYQSAIASNPSLGTDESVYEWLRDQVEGEMKHGYDTWARNLRKARSALNQNKYEKRLPGESRSIRPHED